MADTTTTTPAPAPTVAQLKAQLDATKKELETAKQQINKLQAERDRYLSEVISTSDTIRDLNEDYNEVTDENHMLLAQITTLEDRIHELTAATVPAATTFSTLPIQLKEPQKVICKFYQRGKCKDGDNCKDLHVDEKVKEKEQEQEQEQEEEHAAMHYTY